MRTNKSQGFCDSTYTERFEPINCTCKTYKENMGPCKSFNTGFNEHCVYCDHEEKCHVLFVPGFRIHKDGVGGMKLVEVIKSLFSKGDGGQSSRRNFLSMIPALVIAPKVVPALFKQAPKIMQVGVDEVLGKFGERVSFAQYGASGMIMTPDSVRKVIGEMVLREEYEVHPTALYCAPGAYEMLEEWTVQQARENKEANQFVKLLSPTRFPV